MPHSVQSAAEAARSAVGLFSEACDIASIWSGTGVSHAGDEFYGVLRIERVFSGGPVSLTYCARSPEVGLLHAEISTVFLNVEMRPILSVISNNMRRCLVFEVSNMTMGDLFKEICFLERDSGINETISYAFESDRELTLKHQWCNAQGNPVAESRATLKPGLNNVPYNYANFGELSWGNMQG